MTTIRQVAKAAGVSVGTVSLCLRDMPGPSESTREHVRRIAAQLGYTPHPAFAAIGAYVRNRPEKLAGVPVAWIWEGPNRLGHDKVSEAGARRRARELGYRLETFHLGDSRESKHLSKTLRAQGFLGILVGSYHHPEPLLAMDWEDFSIVACGAYGHRLPFHRVCMDSFAMAMQVYRRVWDRGFRRIGMAVLRHQLELSDDDARLGGLLAMHYRFAPDIAPVPPLLATIADAPRAVPQWFRTFKPEIVIGFPSVVFFSLRESGVKLPEEAAYCGIIHNTVPGYGNLAGFAGRGENFGELAMEWLDELIRHQQRGFPADPRDLLFQGQWIEGRSLPPRVDHS